MADTTVETLLTISDAQLHEVVHGVANLKDSGALSITLHGFQGESGLWLQVGRTEWSVNVDTPVLQAAQYSYMFAMTDGRFLSVLLANGTPKEEAVTFQEILVECTSFEHSGAMTKQGKEELIAEVAQDVETDPDIPVASTSQPSQSSTTAQRISAGAASAQVKLLQSANWASQKIMEQTQAYMEKHEPTQNPVNVSPAVARNIRMARKAAEMGNRAANKVAGGIADLTIKISETIIRALGPKHTGEQLQDPNKRPSAAKEIAAASVLAATGVYDSMTEASQLILRSGGEAASGYVGHRYGKAAGEVANDAAHASVTAGMTYMTTQKIGLRKIARKVAKRTATGLAKQAVLGAKPSGQQQGGAQATLSLEGQNGSSAQQLQPQSAGPQQGYSQPALGYKQ